MRQYLEYTSPVKLPRYRLASSKLLDVGLQSGPVQTVFFEYGLHVFLVSTVVLATPDIAPTDLLPHVYPKPAQSTSFNRTTSCFSIASAAGVLYSDIRSYIQFPSQLRVYQPPSLCVRPRHRPRSSEVLRSKQKALTQGAYSSLAVSENGKLPSLP